MASDQCSTMRRLNPQKSDCNKINYLKTKYLFQLALTKKGVVLT